MTKRIHSFIIPALLLACLLLTALCPSALAAEGTGPADDVTVAEDGTVTLLSTHAADEAIRSAQLVLTAISQQEGTLGFTFSPGLGDRLTQSALKSDGLYIYISGSEPLMAAGQMELVLGNVTGAEPGSVSLAPGSLEYVYGRRTVAQAAAEPVQATPEPEATPDPSGGVQVTPEDAARASLKAELDSVDRIYATDQTTRSKYTSDSWDALVVAIDRAYQVLNDPAATSQMLAEALQQLRNAQAGLVPVGWAALQQALEQAGSYDEASYTPESYAALRQAVAEAQEALAAGGNDESRLAEALSKLEQAMADLVPQTDADSNGEVIHDGADGGGSARAASTPAPGSGGSDGPRSPSTGDGTAILPWALAMGLCAVLAALTETMRRRMNRR